MIVGKLIKKLSEFPPDMEVAVLKHEDDDYNIECGNIKFDVKTADINETCPEILNRVGQGNNYLRLE